MIELNCIYKLKKLKDENKKINFDCNQDKNDYKVKQILDEKTVICENLSTNEYFVFLKHFLIDPDKPDDIYIFVKSVK